MGIVRVNRAICAETAVANFRKTRLPQGYSADVKDLCLKMVVKGMGVRGIERVTGICHNSMINWVRQAEAALAEENYEIPATAQIDQLQTFFGSKNTSSGSGQS